MQFVYPYTVRQSDDGAWQVRFPDIPETMTEGATEAQAHALATDALLAALCGLEKLHRDTLCCANIAPPAAYQLVESSTDSDGGWHT